MTRAIPFTQASVRRAIKAAKKEGLRVREIKPDGTVVVVEIDREDALPIEPKPEIVL